MERKSELPQQTPNMHTICHAVKHKRHTRLLEVGIRLCDADFGGPCDDDAGVRTPILSSGGAAEYGERGLLVFAELPRQAWRRFLFNI